MRWIFCKDLLRESNISNGELMDRKALLEKLFYYHKLLMDKLINAQVMAGNIAEMPTQELMTLEKLGMHPSISMSELAALCYLAPNTATGVVNRMVRRGLVQRRQSDKDRRVVEVALTEEGMKSYQLYLDLHFDFGAGIIKTLTDEEAQTYLKIMEKIARQLESN